eukprot:7626550-Alexandrium_andersonii.AAC.1
MTGSSSGMSVTRALGDSVPSAETRSSPRARSPWPPQSRRASSSLCPRRRTRGARTSSGWRTTG